MGQGFMIRRLESGRVRKKFQAQKLYVKNRLTIRTRTDILNDLIRFQTKLDRVQNELSQYTWDAEEPLVILHKSDFISIAQRFLDGVLSTDDLENWANAIESREDIEFENYKLSEFIFDLANLRWCARAARFIIDFFLVAVCNRVLKQGKLITCYSKS
jgi:hypothetical protein